MPLAQNNITTAKVKNVLGADTNNVSSLCTSDEINPYSYYKPLIKGNKRAYHGINGNCGLIINTHATIEECVLKDNFQYEKANIYRLGDFRQYEHDAPFMWTVSLSPTMTENGIFVANLQSYDYGFDDMPEKQYCVTPDKIATIRDMYLCVKFVITNAVTGTRSNYVFADKKIGELEYDNIDTAVYITNITSLLQIRAGDTVKVYAALSPTQDTSFTYFVGVENQAGYPSYMEYTVQAQGDNPDLMNFYTYQLSNCNYTQVKDTLYIYSLSAVFSPVNHSSNFRVEIRAFGTEQVDENGDDILESNPYQGVTILNNITVNQSNNVFNFSYSDVAIKLTDNVAGEVLIQPRFKEGNVLFTNSSPLRLQIKTW